ncbi:putative 3-phenylpropionate permease [Escherichia coli]|uniref:Putative 3-phenylpropionate permease n=1 Tax=Escherichia coli TaxID=562 RepID=A0A377C6H9_ECOLX|nr:putative 3-phenylpropionate permease [Escherichia coli]
MVDSGANSALRHLHGLPPGRHAFYIAARQGSEVIRLQAVYSAVAMGGSIAIMTVFAGFLYQYLGHGVFWVMALVALPAMFLRPKVVPSC